MTEITILATVITILSVALLAATLLAGYMIYRVRMLHAEVTLQRDAIDKARLEHKASYMEQGDAMRDLTREAVAAIVTTTHMMESVIKGTENGSQNISQDLNKLETRLESWMLTISQTLSRFESRTSIYNTQQGGQGSQSVQGGTSKGNLNG